MCVSHRVTYCDQVGRSKQQQTVVVTANNKRAEACLVEVVSAFVCVHVFVEPGTCCFKLLIIIRQ